VPAAATPDSGAWRIPAGEAWLREPLEAAAPPAKASALGVREASLAADVAALRAALRETLAEARAG
jgi:hypothetical protein